MQEELEKLNCCTDEINRLEVQLDEANLVFRRLLSDSTHHLKALHTRLGSCIEKARPYYEALEQMMRAQAECQQAAVQFQRAAGQLLRILGGGGGCLRPVQGAASMGGVTEVIWFAHVLRNRKYRYSTILPS